MKPDRFDGGPRRRARRSGWRWAATLLLGVLLTAPEDASAQDDAVAAQECCLGLIYPVTARSVALGRAVSSRPGAEAVFANPAGLAALDSAQIVVHHTDILEAEQANAVSILFAPRGVGTLGVSYQLLDFGDQGASDGGGRPTGSLAERQHFLVLSYATGVRAGLSAGINYKLYQFRQDCSGFCNGEGGVATTHLVDAGVQYHPRWAPSLQLGAAVTDLGFRLQVVNASQADRPPTRLRVGGAYDAMSVFRQDSVLSLWVSAEVEYPVLGAGETLAGAGAELDLLDTVFLRAGYRTGIGIGSGPAVGFGARYERFSIGVGKSFYQSLMGDGSPVQVTFGIDL